MSKIVERVPMLLSASALLMGAMVFGAATIRAVNTTVEAACTSLCDAEDADDCSSGCHCNDPSAQCED